MLSNICEKNTIELKLGKNVIGASKTRNNLGYDYSNNAIEILDFSLLLLVSLPIIITLFSYQLFAFFINCISQK